MELEFKKGNPLALTGEVLAYTIWNGGIDAHYATVLPEKFHKYNGTESGEKIFEDIKFFHINFEGLSPFTLNDVLQTGSEDIIYCGEVESVYADYVLEEAVKQYFRQRNLGLAWYVDPLIEQIEADNMEIAYQMAISLTSFAGSTQYHEDAHSLVVDLMDNQGKLVHLITEKMLAVEKENYELAAVLRDEIQGLTDGGKTLQNHP